MIIERISLNQIKFTLNASDLRDRNIKLTELAYGTEKTQALFREMMERANSECGFDSENAPLLIEAVPQAIDSIVIIVTKVTDAQDIEEKFNMLPRPKDSSKFKPKGLIETKTDKPRNHSDENILIYSFANLDDVVNVSSRLRGTVNCTNILFKNESKFYLFMEFNPKANSDSQKSADSANPSLISQATPEQAQTPKLADLLPIEDVDSIMSEFGQRHVSSTISKYYLSEHGEVIVKHPAIDTLSNI